MQASARHLSDLYGAAHLAFAADITSKEEVEACVEKIAENIGCVGISVERPEDIVPTRVRALKTDAPVVVEVMTDGKSNPPITWTP